MTQFSITERLKAFGYAWKGVCRAWRSEHSLWIHTLAMAMVIIAGIVLEISRIDWALLFIGISSVLVTEVLNTAIEKLADTLHPDQAEGIAATKDIAAGAVLVASIFAIGIALCVFGAPIVHLIQSLS